MDVRQELVNVSVLAFKLISRLSLTRTQFDELVPEMAREVSMLDGPTIS